MRIKNEIERRRTFAIISHPDAGKTTLTEKFLLYGGAVQLAGSVTAKRKDRSTASDWMELEKQRGISVSSTVLQFPYKEYCVNLLDTPGHEDFSEDTYRVLTAVDSVIMVLDAAKGIETQTRKLFEVCRMRGLPIFTFINKCDRPGKAPLELLDEIESVLGLSVCPMNWPMGEGAEFRGVLDRARRQALFFQRNAGGRIHAGELYEDAGKREVMEERVGKEIWKHIEENLEILDGAGTAYDHTAVLAGKLSPVFFGSALNNFGVRPLLDDFLDMAPGPGSRESNGIHISPSSEKFSGFVFKIQANMDPKHRDRVAFLRVCSGGFSRDMTVHHIQSGKRIRLSFSHRVFGQERQTQDEGWPGDIIGIAGHSDLGIGDTLTEDPEIRYQEMPRFPPECFAYLRNQDTKNHKRFRSGLEQLLQEKVVQRFSFPDSGDSGVLIGAVGPLQFDVTRFRLDSEYRAPARLEPAPWVLTRWVIDGTPLAKLQNLQFSSGVALAIDDTNRPVLLFRDDWSLRYFTEKNKAIGLGLYPPDAAPRRMAIAN